MVQKEEEKVDDFQGGFWKAYDLHSWKYLY